MNISTEETFLQNSPLTAKAVQKQLMQALGNSTHLPEEEIRPIMLILMEEILQIDKIQLLTDSTLPKFSTAKTHQLKNALERLSKDEPIQYIIKRATFNDLVLKVNQGVLIPRPETEELVALITKRHAPQAVQNILDLGTGSACIAIALARHFKNAKVWAIDLSERALEVAKYNIEQYHVNVKLIQADMLALPSHLFPKFSLIVSNPPYVTMTEKTQMHPNVLNYEPKEALFVEDNAPLRYYEAIVGFAKNHLQKEGNLWVEINAQYGQAVVDLFKRHGLHTIQLYKDLQQKNRFISARL